MKGCTNKKSSQDKRTKINACNLSFKLEAGTAVKFGGAGGGGGGGVGAPPPPPPPPPPPGRDTCQHHLGGEEVVGLRPSRILPRYKLKQV